MRLSAVDNQKLGRSLEIVGLVGVGASIMWWVAFYASIQQAMGGPPIGLPIRCLFFSSGPCGWISGIAGFAGYLAYNPIIFWISAAVIALGIVIDASATSRREQSLKLPVHSNAIVGESANINYDKNRWRTLVEVDPEIAAAANQIRSIAPWAEDELASKYLVLNDKRYLGSLVVQIASKYRDPPGKATVE